MPHTPTDAHGWFAWLTGVLDQLKRSDPALHRAVTGPLGRLLSQYAALEADRAALLAEAEGQRRRMEALETTLHEAKGELRRRQGQIERLREAPVPAPARVGVAPAPRMAPIVRARPARDAASPPAAPPADADAEAVGAAFAAWCREAGMAVSERARFAERLAGVRPGAEVRAVYRDRDSARRPVVFGDERTGSPAEYWVVDGAGGPWLLPFPQGPRQFRDLADGAFQGGRVAPRVLRECLPAALAKVGVEWTVSRPGRLAAA